MILVIGIRMQGSINILGLPRQSQSLTNENQFIYDSATSSNKFIITKIDGGVNIYDQNEGGISIDTMLHDFELP